MNNPFLSIIIPVYNGEKTIESLFLKIREFCNKFKYSYEVIFVWDCGFDNSWQVITNLKTQYPSEIIGISLSRNYGQHNALICGFENANGELIITMDEDLQHDPQDIEKLIRTYQQTNSDVVYGTYKRIRHKWYRNITSNILKRMIKIGIPDLHKDYSAFRLIKKSIAVSTIQMQNSYTFLDGYLSWITKNSASCQVDHKERIAGNSSYTMRKLIRHSINIFTTFSDLPIKTVSWLSFVFFLFAICYSAFILFQRIILKSLAPGYASIIILISIGFGAILLSIGILGHYLHQVNLKTTKRPNYHILKII